MSRLPPETPGGNYLTPDAKGASDVPFVFHGCSWRRCCSGRSAATAADAQAVKKYFAHPAVEDRDGVIAPWYRGQNGQVDFRVRVAAETLKRYPWADKAMAVMAAPHFVFNADLGHQARRHHPRQPCKLGRSG